MKYCITVLVTGCLAFSIAGCSLRNIQQESFLGKNSEESFRGTISRVVEVDYLLFLPKEYHVSTKRFPLILYLHGAGHRADAEKLYIVKREGPPKVAEKIDGFPFIVVSPLCPKGKWWDEDVLDGLLDQITEKYRVDMDRIYVTGLSMGGYGTWALATTFPDRFAAIAPVCGGGEPSTVDKIRHLPVWAFHGAKDDAVPIKKAQRMIDALRKCDGNVKFTVYPEADHNSWSATYGNPYLYEWLLKHRRGHPGKVVQIPPGFRQPLEQWKQRYDVISSTLPKASCAGTDYPPTIDGRLDDRCWSNSEVFSVSTLPGGLPAAFSTSVQVAHDSDNLYFSFRCKEPLVEKIVVKEYQRDGRVGRDDSVEIFLDPNLDRKSYFHFIINADGILYDAAGKDKSWNCDAIAHAGRESDAWTLEVAIPFISLGLARPREGQKIGFNLARTRWQRTWEPAQWAATLGDHHMPHRFGILVFK